MRSNEHERQDEFKKAIEARVFIRSTSDILIVASEHTGVRNPWIFDFRALMLEPKWLNAYAELFWDRFASHAPFQVGGIETAGISLVAAIVMKGLERGTPVSGFYIRKSRKRNGLMKYIEGSLNEHPIILVDDLMNSGQSISKQLDILADAGKKVTDVFEILTFRNDDAYEFLKKEKIRLSRLFTLQDFGMPLLRSKAPEIPQDSFEILWHYKAPNPSYHLVVQKSAPVLDEKKIFFGCDDGVMRALDQKTGKVVWEYSTGKHPIGKGILSSPAHLSGIVYFGAYDGAVYALAAENGKKIWSYEDADWVGSSPSLAPDLEVLFIGLEFGLWRKRGGIAAISLKDGSLKWQVKTEELTHGSPLYIPEERVVIIGSNDGVVYAYDARTGVRRWQNATRGEIKSSFAYDPKRRLVLFGSFDGNAYALSAQNGVPIFAREMKSGIYSTPLVSENTAFIAALDKCLYAIDLNTGKDRWVFETAGRIFASPIIAEDSLWIGSNDGRLYELDPKKGILRNFFQATERIVNRIAYKDGHFFVPTVTNELYCLRRRQ